MYLQVQLDSSSDCNCQRECILVTALLQIRGFSALTRVLDEWLYLSELDEDLEKKPPLDPRLYPHCILDP